MIDKLVSIIIISYNHEAFIDDCMQGVLAQTYRNIEVLYLDDSSSDNSYKKADRYKNKLMEKFGRVEFFENRTNQGVVKNLNKLIPMCEGEYIKFIASDDFMLPSGIFDMVNYLENNPDSAMVYTNGIYGDENMHFQLEISYKNARKLYNAVPRFGTGLFEYLYESDEIMAPTVMIRKSTYDNIGLYDESIMVEDWDCFIRVALYGAIGYLDKPTVVYRLLSTSFSHSDDPNRRIAMKKSELLLLEKYKEYVKDKGKDRIARSYNEAISDACHICDKRYMQFLKEYRKRNQVYVTFRNRMKYALYTIGFFGKAGER